MHMPEKEREREGEIEAEKEGGGSGLISTNWNEHILAGIIIVLVLNQVEQAKCTTGTRSQIT